MIVLLGWDNCDTFLHPLYNFSLDLYSVCTVAFGGYAKGELVSLYFTCCFYEIETWLSFSLFWGRLSDGKGKEFRTEG